jgi:Zn-dependent M28 family amino/carboxypeptidase
MRRTALALLLVLLVAGCGGGGGSADRSPADRFDAARAFADLEKQVDFGPRPSGSPANRRTAEWLAGGLRDAGAEQVSIQRPWRNVVGFFPGTEPDAILLGAHFDTKEGLAPGFEGANDGASGAAVLLEIARALGGRVDGPSVYVAFFDAEEARGNRDFELDGTRGSRQYVDLAARGGGEGVPPLAKLETMILFDMVGDCDLEIPREAYSDRRLYDYIATAEEGADGSAAPFEGSRGPILDDHIPFREAGVPAVDLIDFDFGPDNAYWHTAGDTLDHVCPESLDAVGEAVLRILPATL